MELRVMLDRDYDAESERQKTVEEFYRLQHINQTYDFVSKKFPMNYMFKLAHIHLADKSLDAIIGEENERGIWEIE